jgi:hypothetical protein
MIYHCVFIQFRPEVTDAQKNQCWQEIVQLKEEIPGLLDVLVGPNQKFEHLDKGYSEGFIATFSDAVALARYQNYPAHQATGAKLVSFAEGGKEGIFAYDLQVP